MEFTTPVRSSTPGPDPTQVFYPTLRQNRFYLLGEKVFNPVKHKTRLESGPPVQSFGPCNTSTTSQKSEGLYACSWCWCFCPDSHPVYRLITDLSTFTSLTHTTQKFMVFKISSRTRRLSRSVRGNEKTEFSISSVDHFFQTSAKCHHIPSKPNSSPGEGGGGGADLN